VSPFITISILPNQNAGTGRVKYPARSPASSKVSSNVTTSGVSCVPNSATDAATTAWAYSMVGCRSPTVGIGGVIATFTVLITDGFVGVKSFGRSAVGTA